MGISQQLAKNFREIYFGGNWTASCMRDHLQHLTLEEATTSIHGMNNIATLVCHTTYYVKILIGVLNGNPLIGKDEESFEVPPVNNQNDWDTLLEGVWKDADTAAKLIEKLPENILLEKFTDEKYGNYYRNITGIIEHLHYHLGQIVLIKKMVLQKSSNG